jgi:hypothetical protein
MHMEAWGQWFLHISSLAGDLSIRVVMYTTTNVLENTTEGRKCKVWFCKIHLDVCMKQQHKIQK